MFFISSCSCLCAVYQSQVLSWERKCNWSSADGRCSNYIWVINSFIAFKFATYIRGLMVSLILYSQRTPISHPNIHRVSIVRTFKKIDPVTMSPHCIRIIGDPFYIYQGGNLLCGWCLICCSNLCMYVLYTYVNDFFEMLLGLDLL